MTLLRINYYIYCPKFCIYPKQNLSPRQASSISGPIEQILILALPMQTRFNMSSSKPTRERLLQTASAFLVTYDDWSVPSILSLRSPSCVHHTLPVSLGVPSRSNAEYTKFIELQLSSFSEVRFRVIDDDKTVVDVETGKVVMHVSCSATTAAGDYKNEYIFTLTMDKGGDLVDEIVEFIDSGYSKNFKERLGTAIARERE
jgi:hypothetical protein